MQMSIIGLDIAKNVFQAHGVDENGEAVFAAVSGAATCFGSSQSSIPAWSPWKLAQQPTTGHGSYRLSAMRCGCCRPPM